MALASLVLATSACTVAQERPPAPGQVARETDGPERIELYAEAHGAGPPVLLLHGFGASTYTWRHLVPALSLAHRVIAIDLKGFGRSPKPRDQAYSIYDQAAFVLRYVIAHDLRDLTLVGHSFGGGVALAASVALLGQEPRRLAALVLIDSPAYQQELPWFITLLRTPILGPLSLLLLPPEAQVRRILEFAYHDRRKIGDDAIVAYAAPLETPGSRHALVLTARQIVPADIDEFSKRYARIDVPTLLVWGRHDRIVPVQVGERLERAIRGSRLVVVEESGHIPHEEVPERAVPVIAAFLAQVREGKSPGALVSSRIRP